MKSLKIISTALTLLLVFSVVDSQAQRQRQMERVGPASGGILSAEMTETLQLTDEQRLKILDLRNEHLASMRALGVTFREGDLSPNELRERREALIISHDEELKSVLTEEQFTKLEAIRTARRQAADSRREANRSNRPGRGYDAGIGQGRQGMRGMGGAGQYQGRRGINRPGNNRP
jgi:Spy/CpxP family protein refolding chaperone